MSLDIWLTAKLDDGAKRPNTVSVFDANYTGNVVPMWEKAGVYDALYESDGKTADSITDVLVAGLRHMKQNPKEYTPMNPDNGWGSYDGAVKFLGKFIVACKKHPKAIIGVWR